MADPFSLAASSLALLDLSAKVILRCKHIISTAKDAPRELRTILVEVSSLEAALKNLSFLADVDCGFAEQAVNLDGISNAVVGCQGTLDDLIKELGSLSISDAIQTGASKRQKVKTAVKWTWREGAAKKLLNDVLQYKTTITLSLLSQTA